MYLNEFSPNWSRNAPTPNPRTRVARFIRPLRLCRHTHWRTTSINPHYQAFIIKHRQLNPHLWSILERDVWHEL